MYLSKVEFKDLPFFQTLSLTLPKSFISITGETGAGKSLFLKALSLGFGHTDTTFSEGEVQITFTSSEASLDQGTTCVHRQGPSKIKLNAQRSSLKQVKSLIQDTVRWYKQSSYLKETYHPLTCLDTFGGTTLDAAKHQVSTAYAAWKTCHQAYQTLQTFWNNHQREYQFVQYQYKEWQSLAPCPGEVEDLTATCHALKAAEKEKKTLKDVQDNLAQAIESLGSVQKHLPPALQPLGYECHALVQDLSYNVEKSTGPREVRSLESLEDRLFALRDFMRKHTVASTDLATFGETLKKFLEDHNIEHLTQREADVSRALRVYRDKALHLHTLRVQLKKALEQKVQGVLETLFFDPIHFSAEVTLQDTLITPGGSSVCEFFVAAGGGPRQSMDKVASGGERMRIILAILSLLKDRTSVFLFDEIDQGTSGRVAQAMGYHMRHLAQTCQVIALTHSPQIAALAQDHFHITKHQGPKETHIHITHLQDKTAREEVIATMLSGKDLTLEAHKAAQRLMEQ